MNQAMMDGSLYTYTAAISFAIFAVLVAGVVATALHPAKVAAFLKAMFYAVIAFGAAALALTILFGPVDNLVNRNATEPKDH